MTETHTIKELWDNACDFDKIPRDSKFVEFSEGNYWAKQYDKAMALYSKYQAYNRGYSANCIETV